MTENETRRDFIDTNFSLKAIFKEIELREKYGKPKPSEMEQAVLDALKDEEPQIVCEKFNITFEELEEIREDFDPLYDDVENFYKMQEEILENIGSVKLMFREMDLKEEHRKELEKAQIKINQEKEKAKADIKKEKAKAKADIKKEKEKAKKEKQEKEKAKADIKKEKEKALAKEKQAIFDLIKYIEPETVCEVYNITMEELEQIKAEFKE